MGSTNFENKSFTAHADWYDKNFSDEKVMNARFDSWKNKSGINYWIHERMFSYCLPFVSNNAWLTVGDGTGADAHYLSEKGAKVIASDIASTLLPEAKKRNFITEYSIENVEQLSFADNTFEYTLCKEAFHHFPRPMIGLYEMLRVSSKGVILIEPQDPVMKMPILLAMCNILDKIAPSFLSKLWKNRYSFEPVGNYVYKISEREIAKTAIAINLPGVAFAGFNNNFYHPDIDKEEANNHSAAFRKIKRKLAFRNFLCRLGILPYEFLAAVVFKEKPSEMELKKMNEMGLTYISFPKNPYL